MKDAANDGDGGPDEDDVDALEGGDSDDDNADFQDGESEDDEPEAPTILKGKLSEYVDKEGGNNLLYSGTWTFGLESSDASKFKLTTPLASPFDYTKPAGSYTFTGFFIMKGEDGEKSKVPEEAVTVRFVEQPAHKGKRWTTAGTGENQFGVFTLNGEYRAKGGAEGNKMNNQKEYEKKPKAAGGGSDSEDEDFDAAPADEEELQGLEDDANLSVEELRAKYSGGGGGNGGNGEGEGEGEGEGGEPGAKKARTE